MNANCHVIVAVESDPTIIDYRYILSLKEIEDIIVTARTVEEGLSKLTAELLEYAQEYQAELELYSSDPQRKGQLPIVQRVLELGSLEQIQELFEI